MLHRRGDLVGHVLRGDQRLAIEVTAALRKDLVLDVHARSAGALILDDRADRALDFAIARVGIGNDRQASRGVGDFTDGAAHFRQRDQTDIGITRHVGRRPAGDVTRFEPRLRHRTSHQRIERAGTHHASA